MDPGKEGTGGDGVFQYVWWEEDSGGEGCEEGWEGGEHEEKEEGEGGKGGGGGEGGPPLQVVGHRNWGVKQKLITSLIISVMMMAIKIRRYVVSAGVGDYDDLTV